MSNAGVECAINSAICAMREAFGPDSTSPPLGGGSNTVRFFAGDASALDVVDLHIADCECAAPFLWVRLLRRYRSREFPNPYVGPDNCITQKVIVLELGVARCAAMNMQEPAWKDYEAEAEISLDDSWRLELAQCRTIALSQARECGDLGAGDAIVPFGPEGGIIAWTTTVYLRVDS